MIGFWADFFTFLQVVVALFLIFIIMLQRGKGGGLVGALGGMGGASAFGPKADIQVLKLTIGLAFAWVVIACAGIFFNRSYTQFNTKADSNPPAKKDDKKSLGGEIKEENRPEVTGTDSGKKKPESKESKAKLEVEKDPFKEAVGETKEKKTSTPAKPKVESKEPQGDDSGKPAKKSETDK